MSVLQKCVESEAKVKVYTRKMNGIRGFATGILIAFDKHWNLALMDVDETFSRPRFPRPEYDNGKEPDKLAHRVGQSVMQVLKTRRRTLLCQRHVPQLVMRGEQVVSVQVL